MSDWAWHKPADPASVTAAINDGIQRCIFIYFIILLGGLEVDCGDLIRFYKGKGDHHVARNRARHAAMSGDECFMAHLSKLGLRN